VPAGRLVLSLFVVVMAAAPKGGGGGAGAPPKICAKSGNGDDPPKPPPLASRFGALAEGAPARAKGPACIARRVNQRIQ